MEKIKIAIIGAGSLSAEVLIKLLIRHKYGELDILISETQPGEKIYDVHKSLKNLLNKELDFYKPLKIIENCDLVFLCTSHGRSVKIVPELIKVARLKEKEIKIIDLSGDFRLKDHKLYKSWYGFSHSSIDLLSNAVYGLSEIYEKEIKKASLIANPGCYPTSVILALAPLIKNGLIKFKDIFIDTYSGVSGAGRKPNEKNLAIDVEDNIISYKIGDHPHIPEIDQELTFLARKKIKVSFAPHVVGFKYGILSTIYLKLARKIELKEIIQFYKSFYLGKPFIRIYEDDLPNIKNVVGTNFCDLGIKIDSRTNSLIVVGAIDNLIKGASGQAIQNMNLIFGLKETEGLPFGEIL